MGPHLPRVEESVYLSVTDGAQCRLRVADVHDGLLSVSAPIAAGVPTPDPDHTLLLVFVRNRVRHVIPVRLLGVTDGQSARWTLGPVGAPEPRTRRRFVRGGGGEPVHLWQPGGGEPLVREGTVLDLSEGGLRGRVPATSFAEGESLQVRAWLGDDLVVTAGHVLAVRPQAGSRWFEVIVEYDLPEQLARRLRRYLLAWEVAERRRDRRDDHQIA